MAAERAFGVVDAVDASTDALQLAAEPAVTLGLPVQFRHGDLCAPIPDAAPLAT